MRSPASPDAVQPRQPGRGERTFTADFTPSGCGAPVKGGTVDASTKQIIVGVNADVPTNDIELKLIFNSSTVASSDVGGGQEEIDYTGPNSDGQIPAGDYYVEVCPSSAPAGAARGAVHGVRRIHLVQQLFAGRWRGGRAVPAAVEVLLQRAEARLHPARTSARSAAG